MMELESESIQQLHPLLIDTVFRSIANHFVFHELVECRAVCKDWLLIIDTMLTNQVGFNSAQQYHPKEISDIYTHIANFDPNGGFMLGNVDFDTTPELFNVFNHPHCRQMSTIYLSNCWLTEKSLVYFLREIGPKFEIINLKLDKHNIDKIPSFPYPICRDDKEEDLLKLRKVRRFTFVSKFHILNWYSIGSVFPNLVELTLVTLFFPTKHELFGLNVELPLLRKLIFGVPPDFECPWDSQLFILMSLKLKLVDLGFVDISKFTNLNCLKIFLESQQATLKILSLRSPITPGHPDINEVKSQPFEFPHLPKLIELRIDDVFFKNANILYSIANVEVLRCHFGTAEKWAEIIRRKKIPQSFPNVTRIHLMSIDSKYLIRMAKFFPNLKYLRLNNCTDELLAILYKEFTNLKFLQVMGKITDSGFLGISQQELKEIEGNGNDNNDLLVKVLTGPSIASFKDLENLYIVALSGSSVTENTLRHVFLTSPKLKSLIVFGLKISTELKKMFIAGGFKPYQLTKIFPQLSKDACAFGFVRYDNPLTFDERHEIYNEASKMLGVFEKDNAMLTRKLTEEN